MVKIIHITDPHLPPLPALGIAELNPKRLLGYISWHRKRKAVHRKDVLDALEKDIKKQSAEHIHISGDLTNIALEAEYERAGKWIAGFGGAKKVSVIPGNHDYYGHDMQGMIDRYWGKYARGDKGESFPYIRRLGDAALIGVSSAVPTLPFMANGRVGDAQLAKLGEILEQLGKQGVKRIVSIHHPPQENACVRRRALDDDKAFRHVISQYGAELIIYGHLHHPLKADINGVPVRGGGSCTAHPFAHYQIIEVTKTAIKIKHRLFDQNTGNFERAEIETL